MHKQASLYEHLEITNSYEHPLTLENPRAKELARVQKVSQLEGLRNEKSREESSAFRRIASLQ